MNRDFFTIDHQIFFCDELLATVISFLDFKSAVTFTLCHGHDLMEIGCFKSRQQELSIRCFNALWREMFHRHYFSPPMKYDQLLLEDASDDDDDDDDGTATATKRTNGGCCTSSSKDSHSCITRTPGRNCRINYLEECYRRLDLLDNLTYEHRRRKEEEEEEEEENCDNEEEEHPRGRHRREHFQSRSSVPRKCFHFLPITPSASSHANRHPLELLNYPSVDFPCSSYHLTSPGVEGEYVFLNPFDGEVAVFPNIQMHRDSMVQVDDYNTWSDVARVEQEMYSNHDLIQQQDDEMVHHDDDDGYGDHYDHDDDDYEYDCNNYYYYDDDDDDDHSEKQKEPMVVGEKEVLFGVQDYFRLNLHEYFHEHNRNAGGNWLHPSSFQTLSVDEEEEVVVDWMGVDVHNMVDASGNIIGNMICAAREISVDSVTSTAATARVPIHDPWNAQERADQQSMSRVKSCTEVMAWKKMTKQGKYADARYTCRLDGSPYYMEVCPVKDRVYVCFSPGQLSSDEQEESDDRVESIHRNNSVVTHDEDPHVPPDEIEPQENFMSDLDVMAIKRTRCIQMFPLLRQTETSKCDHKPETTSTRTGRRFFPNVEQKFWSKYPITSLAIEPTGDHIIVGTDNGAIEIWNVQNEPILVQHTDISSQLMRKKTNVSIENSWMESMTTQINSDQSSGENSDTDQSESLERLHEVMLRSHDTNEPFQRRVSYASALDHLNESILRDEIPNDEEILGMSQSMESVATDEYMGVQESSSDPPLCQCNPRRMIKEIILARHLPIQKSGFVTLQHHRDEGTTLALWQFDKQTSSFVVSSLVNLPLSTQRRPSVLYDGKKLVVFGQDHIGLIILIYRVISSPEDRVLNFYPPLLKGKSNSSWGVVNLKGIDTIVYMNRIRHAALGGIEYYDNILMTMNERFLIVNTKTGNLLVGGHRERTDGLLVIDLEL